MKTVVLCISNGNKAQVLLLHAQKTRLVLDNIGSKQKNPEELWGFLREEYLLYRVEKHSHVVARGSFVSK